MQPRDLNPLLPLPPKKSHGPQGAFGGPGVGGGGCLLPRTGQALGVESGHIALLPVSTLGLDASASFLLTFPWASACQWWA